MCNTSEANRVLEQTSSDTIWTFWDGDPPDLVLRCIESVRLQNPHRPIIVVSTDTLPLFLGPDDYPMFHGRRGGPDDFSCPQYLSDWVRLTLLEKYGGVWLDASVICTNSVDSWAAPDRSMITMFPMHANSNIHGNWALASAKPGHPLIQAWREEIAAVLNKTGSGKVPTQYIEQAFIDFPALMNIWNNPNPPPLPYLWVYLALQVVLQKRPGLHATINLLPSIDGPMYRRYFVNVECGITNSEDLSQKTADHLASHPLNLQTHDRYFIKLVGKDRRPCQAYLDGRNFEPGSVLDSLSCIPARSIVYGRDLRVAELQDKRALFRLSVHVINATRYMEKLCREEDTEKSQSSSWPFLSLSTSERSLRASMCSQYVMSFFPR